MPHERQLPHRTSTKLRPIDRKVDWMDGCRPDYLGRYLQPTRSILGLGGRIDACRSQ